ncbi:MAG: PAS domain-containing sensor histidine kinase, partial [Rhizobiales bacterium]|nr:PAS domain-containing sensor histidine kinase [Hyphomicrobiales bacterium]
ISVEQTKQKYNILICDNGIGLPKTGRHKLLEPYMTTRSKGTGLGLAIVKRIMEEHGGNISLNDSPTNSKYEHGALIILSFPINYINDDSIGVNNGR